MRSLSTIVALASGVQLAAAVSQHITSKTYMLNIYRDGKMPPRSLALPTQTMSVTANNPAVLTGALSVWVLSPPMVILNSRATRVPALSVAAKNVIF
jgi:hypothetical protein